MLSASVVERIGIAIASTLLALLIGLGIVAAAGYDPGGFAADLYEGSLGSERAIAQTLSFSTLFVLTGVAVAVAFRAGVFNIGVQGQFVVGGFATAVTIVELAPFLPESAVGGLALLLIGTAAGVVTGGLYAALPGALKAYADANEIITTIMLNFIAVGFVAWLVTGRFNDDSVTTTRTERIPDHAHLPSPVFDFSDLSIVGLAATVLVVALVALLTARTTFGYDMVTSGYQQAAATYSGVDAERMIVSTMTLSGMVAGLGGAVFAVMIQGYYGDPGSVGNYGFDAIAVSLLAANNPVGVIPAALLFGGLEAGGQYIQIASDVPVQLIDGVVGLVVLFVAVPELFRMAARRTGLGGERR